MLDNILDILLDHNLAGLILAPTGLDKVQLTERLSTCAVNWRSCWLTRDYADWPILTYG